VAAPLPSCHRSSRRFRPCPLPESCRGRRRRCGRSGRGARIASERPFMVPLAPPFMVPRCCHAISEAAPRAPRAATSSAAKNLPVRRRSESKHGCNCGGSRKDDSSSWSFLPLRRRCLLSRPRPIRDLHGDYDRRADSSIRPKKTPLTYLPGDWREPARTQIPPPDIAIDRVGPGAPRSIACAETGYRAIGRRPVRFVHLPPPEGRRRSGTRRRFRAPSRTFAMDSPPPCRTRRGKFHLPPRSASNRTR